MSGFFEFFLMNTAPKPQDCSISVVSDDYQKKTISNFSKISSESSEILEFHICEKQNFTIILKQNLSHSSISETPSENVIPDISSEILRLTWQSLSKSKRQGKFTRQTLKSANFLKTPRQCPRFKTLKTLCARPVTRPASSQTSLQVRLQTALVYFFLISRTEWIFLLVRRSHFTRKCARPSLSKRSWGRERHSSSEVPQWGFRSIVSWWKWHWDDVYVALKAISNFITRMRDWKIPNRLPCPSAASNTGSYTLFLTLLYAACVDQKLARADTTTMHFCRNTHSRE